jgi:nucleoside-diphosphate-sugar epimerase
MKLLVTGSNGFVGSHIVEHFAKQGHEVYCLVRATSDCKWLANLKVHCVTGDISRPETLRDAVKGMDVIVHAAAMLRALTTREYYVVNQHGTRNLAEAALKFNPSLKHFIHISSQAAMGPSAELRPKLINEPNTPVSDYGRSKLAGEKVLISALHGKIPYTILRPSSVYGPRDKDIFIFFRLVNFGVKLRTLNERFIQLLFVEDIPIAVERALSLPVARDKIYCLGENSWNTWAKVAQAISNSNNLKTHTMPLPDWVFGAASFIAEAFAKLTGRPAVLNRQKITEMRQPYWIADVTPSISELGLDFTNLSRGAKITFNWYKENKWL